MPSLEAPNHYERCSEIAPSKFDPFFKWVSSDFLEEETSETECPLGWIGLTKIDLETIDYYTRGTKEYFGVGEFPDLGWYLVRITDSGIVFGFYYGPDYVLNEEKARADFAEAAEAYADWYTRDL